MIRTCNALLLMVGTLMVGACGQTVSDATPSTSMVMEAPPIAPLNPDADGLAVPPGQTLPDDAACAGRVVASGPEVRPSNTPFNQTRGRQQQLPGLKSRVTGNFTGTTDEIIQWAACKWGIDADVVRAQAVKESTWRMTTLSDFTDDSQWCAPGHVPGGDGEPGCPQSVGILQVKYRYNADAFPMAAESTAYNLDWTLAAWRMCFEGQTTWLADNPPGSGYKAGDMWGCLGSWFAGDWRSDMARGYIRKVQQHYRDRAWQADWFLALE